MSVRPLSGIRVIDFSWVGAGPYATKLLADQGADVIKIESSKRIDGLRLTGPFAQGTPGINRSGYFAERNSSKRSCALNLKTVKGQQIARQLIEHSDVVVNSFTPGVMDRLGLGWENVKHLNPSIVYLAMSMHGDSGPYRDHLGFGLTISAITGLYGMSGRADQPPAGTGTNYPDHIPNPCHAAFAVLAALRHARRTGRGQYIDLAQTEATASTLGTAILERTVNGRDRERNGNRHDSHAPYGVYPCAGHDRWIAIAVTTDAEFRSLHNALNVDSARLSPDLDSTQRKQVEDLIDHLVSEATVTQDHIELAIRLQEHGIPAAPVYDAADLMSDPQLEFRQHWVRLKHAEMGESVYSAPPFIFDVTSEPISKAAPRLGEHTVDICSEILGMSAAEISELEASGVLS